MFSKVLVANRGEIAVRIIRSLKELGVKTVAIYSDIDKDSLHVQLADEAVCVGSSKPQDSYLNMNNILAAAIGTGAQAIHPGFGFLAENSRFVEMCETCGLTFIGPSSTTMDLMGNKSNARLQMIKHHIPVIPGSDGYIETIEEAKAVAKEIGYPILLKAAAGGGGKGIRLVKDESHLADAFFEAKSEALNAFGDQKMYIEKIMEDVKHIEVQFLCDNYGQTIYFPERDCSIQRNKQKLVEESPSPLISPKERQMLGELALKAAKAVNYQNTGTVEFLMDRQHNFYFMEMNTRIQVEHTLSEVITGVDIVKEQIKIASGEPLNLKQSNIKILGHAIECRINAEDPAHNFCPAVGTIDFLYWPVGNLGMRIDSALYPGATISHYYDSMVAKMISFAPTRTEAIIRMQRILSETVISGIKTNCAFHLALLKDPDFIKGAYSTNYLEGQFLPEWKKKREKDAVI